MTWKPNNKKNNQQGLSIIEIIVSVAIFMVLFASVATIYVVGISLQYRTELGTSAHFISNFLLEYFIAAGPHNILYEPVVGGVVDKPMVPNLPYPEGGYAVIGASGGVVNLTNIYNAASTMTPPSFIRGRLFRSEWAPHPQFFPNIFTLDDFRFLPSGMNLTEVNNLFPPTVFFREVSGGVSGGNTTYRMIINSFPPFLIAAPLELRYQLEVRETTGLTKLERQAYEVTVRVRWVVGGNERTFTLKRLVAHGW